MKSQCSAALLESALNEKLPTNDEALLHRHLAECEECNAALEQMAGGPAWCQEAASLLTEDDLDAAWPSNEEWSAVDFTVEHLEPADEPNVLGRLGGYDVLEVIGQGGMGVVLKAFDRELKRLVAIKVLAPHLSQSSLAKNRFAREAQAAAAVVHPHVLAIHQVQSSGRLPFLVMPLVAGESLAERLTAKGTLELKETLRIGMQAAAGLGAAHEQGLVHRDVKPANILLEKGIERAVLTDFGLARAADDVTLTRWGIIAGTPQYMSPEQVRGEPLDGRSDLFSLGCVLYEMATGVSPFRSDSLMATMRRLVDDAPHAMGSLNPELSPWFIAIVDRLLEKDPARRFNSANEVSELLEACLAHVQQPANVPLPVGVAETKPAASAADGDSRRRLFRGVGAIVAFLFFGASGFGAFMIATREPADISGEWSGEGWDKVLLKGTGSGKYAGTYTDTFGKQPGKIELKWSRIESRYNGTWSEGEDRFGKISVRQTGDEIRGAWTTHRKAKINSATPGLADLTWVRSDKNAELQKRKEKWVFSPTVERTVADISTGKNCFLNLDRGELLSPPANVRELEEMRAWAEKNDADVAACGDGGGRGLRIFGGLAIQPADWDLTPEAVADEISNTEIGLRRNKATNPALQGPSEMGFSNLWAAKDATPTFFIKTRHGRMGLLQILGVNESLQNLKIRYKLMNSENSDSPGIKRQRFQPTEGRANDTNWTVLPPPSMFSKNDWATMARMTIGGEARIQLPDDKEPRCVIKLIKGNDDDITVQVEDAAKKSKLIVSIQRDHSARVTVDGAGYDIYYPSIRVSLNDPDTSPFAEVIVRRIEEPKDKDGQANVGKGLTHRVPFEVGASYFRDGDQITIQEVRGTSETISAGNTYEIKGTYRLGSAKNADQKPSLA